MATEVRTYDPDQVTVTWGPYEFQQIADGDSIEAERNEDAVALKVGLHGDGARTKNRNISGKFTVRLMQTSPSNDDLSAAALADANTNPGVVHPFKIADHNGQTQAFSPEAWIVKVPKLTRGKDLGNAEWVFECLKMPIFIGGSVV